MSDTWCVYRREWTEVYRNGTLMGREACRQAYLKGWAGKVGPEEWRLVTAGMREPFSWTLEIMLPNLKGEYKDQKRAEVLQKELPGSVVVLWGSKEEEALLDYGTRMLKSA